MLMPKETLTTLLNSPFAKFIGGAFLVGMAWARLEYKIDAFSTQLLKKIDEHIISDGFEKQLIQVQLTAISSRVTNLEDDFSDYKEAIKPDEPTIKPKKYR